MRPTPYRDLLLHMEWADARVWNAALAVPGLAGNDRLRERLHHFHATQWAYLQLFQGRPIEIPELRDLPDLRSVGRWARGFYQALPAVRDGLDEARLDRTVTFPWADQIAERLGNAGPSTMGDCLVQLALHTAHHRGQVATQLREAGSDVPLTDFIAWVWLSRPAPQWGSFDDP